VYRVDSGVFRRPMISRIDYGALINPD
jgi:hypothetical protein